MLRLAGALAAAALAIGSVTAISAGDATQVAVRPASAHVAVGEEFPLEFTLAGVPETPGVGGYVLALQWDPRHLELVSLADAGFVTRSDNIVVCGEPVVESAEAVLFCATIPLFGAPGVSTVEPTVFAHSSFRALAAGETTVELDGSYLEGPAEEQLPATLAGATVTIAEPVADEPEAPPDGDSTSGPAPTLVEVKPPAAGSGFPSGSAGSGDGRAWLLAAMALALSGAVASGLTFHRARARLRDDEKMARTQGR